MTLERDHLPDLVAALAALRTQCEITGDPHRARAYGRVHASLRSHVGPVRSVEDVAGLPGVGPSIRATLAQLIEKGTDGVVQPGLQAIQELQTVTSFGPMRAQGLAREGVTGVADLRDRVGRGQIALNAKEALGLRHWEDFRERIPRVEMDLIRAALEDAARAVAPTARLEIMGSYRRGAASSGDIDAAVIASTVSAASAAMRAIVARLVASGIGLRDHFGFGAKKYLGIVRLDPTSRARRLDLMAVPEHEAPFALLYFTGSDLFNVRVRGVAKQRGLSMNEHGFKSETDAAHEALADSPPFLTEADVLAFLGLPNVEPVDRIE